MGVCVNKFKKKAVWGAVVLAGMGGPVAGDPLNVTVNLVNNTGLSNMVVCAQGYSITSGNMFNSSGQLVPLSTGGLPGVAVPNGGTGTLTVNQDMVSARFYYFVTDATTCASGKLIGSGGATTPPGAGPLTGWPPFTLGEPDFDSANSQQVFDLSQVDSFGFPATAETQNTTAGYTRIGQPNNPAITADVLVQAYQSHMTALGALGQPYLDLVLPNTSSYPAGTATIVNPHHYLSGSNGCPSNVSSPLHTVFDAQLNEFFGRNDNVTVIKGNDPELTGNTQGTTPAGNPASLVFTGTGGPYTVYNPVGQTVYANGGVEITANWDPSTAGQLNFQTPMPADSLSVGMYVGGGNGLNGPVPGPQSQIQSVHHVNGAPEGLIDYITVSNAQGNPGALGTYCFSAFSNSQVPSGQFASSGDAVFGNWGVFKVPSNADLGNELVTALNRGVSTIKVANCGTLPAQIDSYCWANQGTATQGFWYPESSGAGRNLYAHFLHTGTIDQQLIFQAGSSTPAIDAQNKPMGMAYGFGYDENSISPTSYAQVPPKWDGTLDSTATVTLTFGPWVAQQPRLFVTMAGAGSVLSAPAGINCTAPQSECSALFDLNQQVVLSAQNYTGKVSWNGACKEGNPNSTPTCTVTMATSQTVSVKFGSANNTYAVGGTVQGLAAGKTLVLENMGDLNDTVTTISNGAFTFPVKQASATRYHATVLQHPGMQTCLVKDATGVVDGANVSNIQVDCHNHTKAPGRCGVAEGVYFPTEPPAAELCASGTLGRIRQIDDGRYRWSCSGWGGGKTAICYTAGEKLPQGPIEVVAARYDLREGRGVIARVRGGQGAGKVSFKVKPSGATSCTLKSVGRRSVFLKTGGGAGGCTLFAIKNEDRTHTRVESPPRVFTVH